MGGRGLGRDDAEAVTTKYTNYPKIRGNPLSLGEK